MECRRCHRDHLAEYRQPIRQPTPKYPQALNDRWTTYSQVQFPKKEDTMCHPTSSSSTFTNSPPPTASLQTDSPLLSCQPLSYGVFSKFLSPLLHLRSFTAHAIASTLQHPTFGGPHLIERSHLCTMLQLQCKSQQFDYFNTVMLSCITIGIILKIIIKSSVILLMLIVRPIFFSIYFSK